MAEYMTVEEMKKRKKELGYSYEQIAELAELPVGTVQKVLGGITKSPRYRTLQALQGAFAVEDRLDAPSARQNMKRDTVHTDFLLREEMAPYGVSMQKNGSLVSAGAEESSHMEELPHVRPAAGRSSASENASRLADADMSASKADHAGFGALVETERSLYDDFEPKGYEAEWIDGVRYDRSVSGPLHQRLVMGIWRSFLEYVTENQASCCALATLSVVMSDREDRTIVWPDVMLLCDREKVRQGRVYGAPDLVVEVVSGDSLILDGHVKLARYAYAGVREYWLVYPGQKRVVVYDFIKKEAPQIYRFTEPVPVGILDGACAVNLAEVI